MALKISIVVDETDEEKPPLSEEWKAPESKKRSRMVE
jgi:hypothetical protein